VTGRILSFEHRTRDRATASSSASTLSLEMDELVIVTDDGAVHTTDLDAGVSVSLVEADLRQQVGSYLDLVSAARAPDLRRMLISTIGTKARPLFVSYISEVPVADAASQAQGAARLARGKAYRACARVDGGRNRCHGAPDRPSAQRRPCGSTWLHAGCCAFRGGHDSRVST